MSRETEAEMKVLETKLDAVIKGQEEHQALLLGMDRMIRGDGDQPGLVGRIAALEAGTQVTVAKIAGLAAVVSGAVVGLLELLIRVWPGG